MASNEPTATTRRITLTREQRDALHALIADELPHTFGGDRFDDHSLDHVREVLGRARPLIALLDAIGWDADDGRGRHELDVDVAWLRAFLQRRRADVGQDLGHEHRALAGALAGDADWLIGPGLVAESEREARRSIDRDLDELARIDLVLEALGETRREV